MATRIQIAGTTIEIANQGLLPTTAAAIMLSANNHLKASPTRWRWSQEVEKQAGSSYQDECAWLSRSAGPDGLHQGSAVVTGAGDLAATTPLRRVVQAITIHYDQTGKRRPATPAIVYRAVRAGLEKAEIYPIPAVATYLMAIRPGYGAGSDDQLADALFRAFVDHAAIAASVAQIIVCETDPARLALARRALTQRGPSVA